MGARDMWVDVVGIWVGEHRLPLLANVLRRTGILARLVPVVSAEN